MTEATVVKEFIKRGANAQRAVDKIMANNSGKAEPKVHRSISRVEITTDYDSFKRLPGNRPLIPAHVSQLVDRMRQHDLLVPVIVNEKMEVIDGQHRIEARRELELPVPYIQSNGMDLGDVQMLNSTSRGWVSDDYCRSYIEQGNTHYVTYANFRSTYGLPHEASLLLLAGRGPKALRAAFISGEFRVYDLDGARQMGSILNARIRPMWEQGWKDSYFVRALYIANSRIGWDMERFLTALAANRHMLLLYRSVDQYLLMIENIFNTNSTGKPGLRKIPIRFGKSPTGAAVHGNQWKKDRAANATDAAAHAAMSDAKRKSMTAPKPEPREVKVIKGKK